MNAKRCPAHVAALARIGDSNLPAVQRDVLRVMLRWWNPSSGELWPAIQSIADDCGRNVATIRRAIRSLEALGIVELTQRTRGGIDSRGRGRTHTMRLHLVRLNPRTTPGLRGANPRATSDKPAHGVRQTRAPRPGNHPSMEHTSELPMEPVHGSATVANGCMADPMPAPLGREALRDALAKAGIRGQNLDRLANSTLTPGQVQSEADSIRGDATVRNRPAVLATRLATLAGVTLSDRPKLDAKTSSALGSIEQMRRNLHNSK